MTWFDTCRLCSGSGNNGPNKCANCQGLGKVPLGAFNNGGPGQNPKQSEGASFPKKDY